MQYIFRFQQTDRDDAQNVGKKAVIFSDLVRSGIPIAEGFVISKDAFEAFLRENNLKTKIDHLLGTIDYHHPESVLQVSNHIKKLIKESALPEKMVEEFLHAYHGLTSPLKSAAVRMHTSRDGPLTHGRSYDESTISTGDANLLFRLKDIWSSHFSSEYLRSLFDFPKDFPKGSAIIIQHIMNADVSGVMYTASPITNEKKQLVIEAVFGDDVGLESRSVTPDRYEIEKASLSITRITQIPQTVSYKKTDKGIKEVLLPAKKGKEQKLTSLQIQYLAQIGKKVEQMFFSPQEIIWALKDNKFVILDTHTLHFPIPQQQTHDKSTFINSSTLATGIPVSSGITTGPTKIVTSVNDAKKVEGGDIVVIKSFDPNFRPYLKKASGIISQSGGSLSDGAAFARHVGIPAVSGVENALKLFRLSYVVSLNGKKGVITKPSPVKSSKSSLDTNKQSSATKLLMNLSSDTHLTDSLIAKTDGLGLLPSEKFIKSIGIHPKKVINDGKKEEYITKLSSQIAEFCRSFSPLPVIYRASDMTTQDYRKLIGGKEYEPTEENPVMGYRGAYRYIREPEVFSLELEAIKMVRNKFNHRNLSLMIPFVRTVKELIDVKKIISLHGLYRSPSFKIWMMAEVPSNIFLAEKYFQAGIDGIIIGSEDLTMLLLGTDHHNSEVAKDYSEGDEAVHLAIEHLIKTAKKNNVDTLIHFDSPTFQEDFIEKIVKWGITGISVAPLDLEYKRDVIIKAEKKLVS